VAAVLPLVVGSNKYAVVPEILHSGHSD
jgi:hypothetical protein